MGGWVDIPGYYPVTLQDPYLDIFSLKGPTYGQMKPILEVPMRFPRIDPE